MHDGGDCIGCFEVEVRADTAKFPYIKITGFGQRRYLIREGETFVKK